MKEIQAFILMIIVIIALIIQLTLGVDYAVIVLWIYVIINASMNIYNNSKTF